MWGVPKLKTTNPQVFLADEYAKAYKRVFKTYQEFEECMAKYVRACIKCNGCYWLSGTKRCDCEFEKANNHAKE